MRRLLKSGWWVVAVAAVVIAVLLVLSVTREGRRTPGKAPSNAADAGFDLSTSTVPIDRIVASGMRRDGLLALDQPLQLSADEVEGRNQEGRGKFLLGGDRVVGVAVGTDARAYPLRFMRWHEVVNDIVGGIPIVVTYNGLCDAVVVAERTVTGDTLSFGVSGLLYNSNLLLYDRRPDASSSLWSQLQGRAITGPAAARGQSLKILPAALTSWEDWLTTHPGSTVLAPIDRLARAYKRDPYHSYFGSDILRFPVEPLPPEDGLGLKDRVVAVTLGQKDVVFGLPLLAAAAGRPAGEWTTTVADTSLRIHFDATKGLARVIADEHEPAGFAVRHAFWFAWFAQHPDAKLQPVGTKPKVR